MGRNDSDKPTLPKLTLADIKADQQLIFDELSDLDALLLLRGVPTHAATGGFRNSLPCFLLHQTYTVDDLGPPYGKFLSGNGDCLRWGMEHIDFEPRDMLARAETYPFLRRAPLLQALYEEHELGEASPNEFRYISFSYSVDFRPNSRFFVCGFLIEKEVRWVLTMLRHGSLRDEPLSAKEQRLYMGNIIKDEDVRRVTREEARAAIAGCANIFMEGYQPYGD
jgi:hypothetical protein